jgi:cell wall-associated NlpC family hydrolase
MTIPKIALRSIAASGIVAAALILASPVSADATTQTTGSRIVSYIEAHDMGKPYRYGATGPYAFDCSGLTYSASHKIGDWGMPRTAEAQRRVLGHVSYAQRRPGDFVFFGYPAYHVGIYIGVRWYNGAYRSMMIDAPHTGTVVRVEPVYYPGAGYVSFGRP